MTFFLCFGAAQMSGLGGILRGRRRAGAREPDGVDFARRLPRRSKDVGRNAAETTAGRGRYRRRCERVRRAKGEREPCIAPRSLVKARLVKARLAASREVLDPRCPDGNCRGRMPFSNVPFSNVPFANGFGAIFLVIATPPPSRHAAIGHPFISFLSQMKPRYA